jgi:hypothetical protein
MKSPRTDFLHETLAKEDSRRTLLFLLAKMGLFAETDSAESQAVRNAAVKMLNDISEQTGFVLDINLIR